MEFIYAFLSETWDDTIIYLNKDDAIRASMDFPEERMEIFRVSASLPGAFVPTYHYYENGVYH